MHADNTKRSRWKSSERKQKTPTGRGGTLGRPPCWRNVIPFPRMQENRKKRENKAKTCVRACKERNRRFGMLNGIMCEMNDFRFRIVLTRTHAGFLVFLPHFFISRNITGRSDAKEASGEFGATHFFLLRSAPDRRRSWGSPPKGVKKAPRDATLG